MFIVVFTVVVIVAVMYSSSYVCVCEIYVIYLFLLGGLTIICIMRVHLHY